MSRSIILHQAPLVLEGYARQFVFGMQLVQGVFERSVGKLVDALDTVGPGTCLAQIEPVRTRRCVVRPGRIEDLLDLQARVRLQQTVGDRANDPVPLKCPGRRGGRIEKAQKQTERECYSQHERSRSNAN